jgi:hypothetical protein
MTRDTVQASKQTLSTGIARRLFGTDVFISYARSDAQLYARQLAKQLNALDISCFIDVEHIYPGQLLTPALERALARSTALILIASAASETSSYVGLELRAFKRTGRSIIPVRFKGQHKVPPLESLGPEVVWIDDTEEHLLAGLPSPAVAVEVRRLLGARRRNNQLRFAGIAVVALFLAIGGLAIQQRFRADTQTSRSTMNAQLATQSAADAKKQKQVALDTAKIADDGAKLAKSRELAADALGAL